jgi:integrase
MIDHPVLPILNKSQFIQNCKHKFGSSCVTDCTRVFKQWCTTPLDISTKHNVCVTLASLSGKEKFSIHTVKINVVRCLWVLGGDVQFVLDDLEEYTTFVKAYSSEHGRRNITRIYDGYYTPLVAKFPLESLKSGYIDHDRFMVWLKSITSGRTLDMTLKVINIMGVHESVTKLLDISSDTKKMYTHLANQYFDTYGRSTHTLSYMDITLEELESLVPLDAVPTIPHEVALKWCRNNHNTLLYIPLKINILEMLQYPKADEIRAVSVTAQGQYTALTAICTALGVKYNAYSPIFYALRKEYNVDDITLIQDMNVNDIALIYTNRITKQRQITYRVLEYILKDHPDKVREMQKHIEYTDRSIKVSDVFKDRSTWHAELLVGIMAQHSSRIAATSSYTTSLTSKIKYNTVVLLNFIESHATTLRGGGATTLRGDYDVPLRWFLHVCSIAMITDVILQYGRSVGFDNSRVKNQINTHHAKRHVSRMISLFKSSVVDIIPCPKDVLSLKISDFLVRIENKRILPDASIRRTFTDGEVQAMIDVVQGDHQYLLLLTILKEIALRAGALLNMMYKDLIDDFNHPRHICKVKEKGNTTREFVTSPNLKQLINSYITWVTGSRTKEVDRDIYIFGTHPHTSPLGHSTLFDNIKRIAFKAGVTEVNVYPHAFRHTIVGKLMDEGNSSEVVSKFMGHSSVDTTMNYYWVKTIDELTRDLKNPFIKYAQTPDEKTEECNEEMTKLQRKLDSALEIIFVYSTHITKGVQYGTGAQTVYDGINKEIPDLYKLLRGIEDTLPSEGGGDEGGVTAYI